MKKNLTHEVVKALKPPVSGQVDVWDSRTPAFGVRLSAQGTKTWTLMYRQGGKKRRVALGRFPQMGVADARNAAKSIAGKVAEGYDPVAEKEAAAAEKAAAEAAADAEPTFAQLGALYLERHAAVHKRPRSVREDTYMLNADLLPAWGERKITDIKRRDVIALLDDIVARGAKTHANRVRALASTMFAFAVGRDLLEANPVYKVPRPALERPRDRVLTSDEVRSLWTAVEPEPLKVKAFYQLALLTAARRGELLGMEWRELELDDGWWALPAARSKNKQPRRIPLAPTAVNLLRLLEAERKSDFVFRGGRIGRPVANPQKWAKRITKRAELANYHFHDLRRTCASGLASIGIDRLVIAKILGHAESSVTGKVYDLYNRATEKKTAASRWDRHLERLLSARNDGPKLVALHG